MELGAALSSDRGAHVVVTGVADESDLAADLATAIPGATDVAGKLSLSALTGLLARSDLLVSNDTAPHHLAAAIGTAVVGVFWIGNAVNGGR
jgi:ADP-heptose:LPS heptosyltransferase